MTKLFSFQKIYSTFIAICIAHVAIFAFLVSSVSAISVPQYMSYQGQLFDADDEPVDDTVSIEFTIYDALSGGSELWSETQSVTVDSGYFAVTLGSVTPLSLDWDEQYFITLNIDSDGEMSPRQSINTAAYAFVSDVAYRSFATSSAPSGAVDGSMYFDTDNNTLYVYNGSSWMNLVTSTAAGAGDVIAANNNTFTGTNTFSVTTTVSGPALLGSYLQFTTNGSNHLYFDGGTTNRISWNDTLDQFEITNDLSITGSVTSTAIVSTNATFGTLTVTSSVSFPNNSITDAMIPNTITASNYLAISNNLSDLGNTSTARTNLGLGSIATASASDYLQSSNNLSDLLSTSTARTNLGLVIGTNVQAYDADLATFAALSPSGFLIGTGSNWAVQSTSTFRTSLGLGTIATAASGDYLAVANNLSDLNNASTARTNLGLGTIATAATGDYLAISGGTLTGTLVGTTVSSTNGLFSSVTTTALVVTGTATSSFAGSINLPSGYCFAVDGTCLTGGGGSGTVNSGTSGYLAYYPSTGTTVDDSGLYWSGTSLSIGTTFPSSSLHVVSTTEQLRLGYNGSNYSSFTVSSGGDLTIAPSGSDTNITGALAVSTNGVFTGNLTANGNLTIGDASSDTVTANAAAWTFANDTTVALTGGVNGLNFDSDTLSIDATNDRVGIGTSTPALSFHVVENQNGATSLGISNTTNGTAAQANMVISRTADFSDDFLSFGVTAPGYSGTFSDTAYLQSTGNTLKIGTAGSQELQLFTNGVSNARMIITSAGLVSIGETSPSTALQVEGAAYTAITNAPATLLLQTTDSQASGMGSGVLFGGVYTGSTQTAFGYIGGVKENGTSGNYAGKLVFGTRANGGGAADMTRMTLTSDGSLGIGDTTPDYLLDVAGTLGIDGALTIGDASGDTVTSNAAAWTFANDTTVALTGGVNGINFDSNTLSIDATNNRVGIGDPAPEYPLHVLSTSDPQLLLERSGAGSQASMRIRNGDASELGWGYDGSENFWMYDYTDLEYLFVLNSTDRAGLWTSAPDKALEINSATGANLRLTYNDSNGSATNYADFSMSSGGDLTIAPSGNDTNVTGNLGVSAGGITVTHATSNNGITLTYSGVDGRAYSILSCYNCGSAGLGGLEVYDSTAGAARAYISAGVNGWQTPSDVRLKDNIVTLDVLGRIDAVRGVSYELKDSGVTQIGVVAQEMKDAFPEVVSGSEAEGSYLGVNYNGVAAIALQGVKEVYDLLKDQQVQITALANSLTQGGGVDLLDGSFDGTLRVKKHVVFGQDSVGQAKILSGSVMATITFAEVYEYMPIVAVTPVGSEVLAHDIVFVVTDKTTSGFTIQIATTQPVDVVFDWHAFASEAGKLFVSDGTTEDIQLIVVDETSSEAVSAGGGSSSNEEVGSQSGDESVVENGEVETEGEDTSGVGVPLEDESIVNQNEETTSPQSEEISGDSGSVTEENPDPPPENTSGAPESAESSAGETPAE